MNEKPSPEPVLEPDPVIEAYKKDVDRTLLRENLKRTVEQRFENLVAMARLRDEELEKLIAVKRAAGRPKDLEAIAELEALREERDRQGP